MNNANYAHLLKSKDGMDKVKELREQSPVANMIMKILEDDIRNMMNAFEGRPNTEHTRQALEYQTNQYLQSIGEGELEAVVTMTGGTTANIQIEQRQPATRFRI